MDIGLPQSKNKVYGKSKLSLNRLAYFEKRAYTVKEAMEYKLERLNTTLMRSIYNTPIYNRLVYCPEPDLQQIYERLARKSRNLFYPHRSMVGHLFQNYDTIYVRFIPKYMTILSQTHIYMRTKNAIYLRYKQACGIWGHRKSSYKGHRIIPSAKNPFMYDGAEK